jgi:hypothetical protein
LQPAQQEWRAKRLEPGDFVVTPRSIAQPTEAQQLMLAFDL